MTRRSLRTTCTVSLIGLLIGCSTSDETNPSRGGGGDSSVADSAGYSPSGTDASGAETSAGQGGDSSNRPGDLQPRPPQDQLEKGPGPDQWVSKVWERFAAEGPTGDNIGDFSYAGYRRGEEEIPEVPVVVKAADHGVVASDGEDDTQAIEAAIQAAHAAGGGAVLLPSGRLDVGALGRGVEVTHSNIVLRGEGSGPEGTIVHLTNPVERSAAIVLAGEKWPGNKIATGTSATSRGAFELAVDDSSGIQAGMKARIQISVPEGDPSLANAMVAPFQLDAEKHQHSLGTWRMDWFVEVFSVPNATTVSLAQPFRIEIPADWTVELFSHSMIEEVGIENLRIDTAWPGGYQHHKAFGNPGDPDYRSAAEQDYHWPGVLSKWAWNGWVRNVTIANANWGVDLRDSKAFSLLELVSEGHASHTFISFGGHDHVAIGSVLNAPAVHPFYHANRASGNVIAGSSFAFEPHPESKSDRVLDYHGLFPYENLSEGVRDAYVQSGGHPPQLPHAGIRHVFWDIRAPEKGPDNDEFFNGWSGTSSGNSNETHAFEHYPQSFLVGVHRAGDSPILVQQSPDDRSDEWLTIEGLNQEGVFPTSLYGAQLELRLNDR